MRVGLQACFPSIPRITPRSVLAGYRFPRPLKATTVSSSSSRRGVSATPIAVPKRAISESRRVASRSASTPPAVARGRGAGATPTVAFTPVDTPATEDEPTATVYVHRAAGYSFATAFVSSCPGVSIGFVLPSRPPSVVLVSRLLQHLWCFHVPLVHVLALSPVVVACGCRRDTLPELMTPLDIPSAPTPRSPPLPASPGGTVKVTSLLSEAADDATGVAAARM